MGGHHSKENVEYEELDLSHFKLMHVIGRGGFGMVRIVEEKTTKKQYALKYINKRTCIKKHSVENIFRERLLLQELDHPYIINLRFAFQDDDYMFMGLDLALGGDLKYQINHENGITENTIRVYMAEISLALSYIHSHQIIHRDIKPENLLIDSDGHIRITDFNVAASTKEKFPSSRSGTLTYMAPEMLSGKPYSYAVDWWALGTVMFECFYGHRPFPYENDDEIKRSIRKEHLKFPKPKKNRKEPDPEFKNIIEAFLDKNKDTRLGSGGTDAFQKSVSKHAYFSSIDWDLIEQRKILPEFIPDMTKENFEPGPALEELLYDSAPLTPRRRKKKPQSSQSGILKIELSRDSLKASLSASRNLGKSSSSSKNEKDNEKELPTPASESDLHNKRDKNKKSEKERHKEREKRELQFIEDYFTVYVQGTGIGILDKGAVNNQRADRALDSPEHSPAMSDASLPFSDDGSVEDSPKSVRRSYDSAHYVRATSMGSMHNNSNTILPIAPSRLKEVVRAESLNELSSSRNGSFGESSQRSQVQPDIQEKREPVLAA